MSARIVSLGIFLGILAATQTATAQMGAHWRRVPYEDTGPIAPAMVHVDLDEPNTFLEEVSWRVGARPVATRIAPSSVVCAAPCSVDVPAQQYYRVTGPGMPPSEAFELPSRRDVSLIVTRRGDAASHNVGAVLTLLGGLSFCAGSAGFAASGWSNGAAEGFLITGLVALAVGIPLWLTNSTTV